MPPSQRELIATADLWSALSGSGSKARIDPAALADLVELVERAVTDHAPIADPADLAKVLARQARDAKDSLPEDLRPVTPLLDDYRQALGLAFEFGDPKGDRFFRSSLAQTVFYSLFAAWNLWDRKRSEDSSFDLEQAQAHLRLPFLEELFYDLRRPQYLQRLDLSRHLERAVATLNRVDRVLFRQRLNFPRIDDEAPTVAAITYFYEPFLEAFDPELRADLGVWYTPPEIVRYQVGRVHHLLKTELGIARGLADPEVVVLDPCCGTGAYLLEVARCIAAELRAEGDRHVTGQELRSAFTERVIGFEILTAPFAIAQLQLLILLSDLGAEIPRGQRLAVYLTNALTGWHDPGEVKLTFPEMREEFTASQGVKRDKRIIVVLGNPPYDRFAGVAQAEEAELVAHYKGIELVIERDSDGQVRRDEFDRPRRKQRGKSLLYKEFGVRKQLLDDLYIRFIRLAEQRIGEAADRGIVSFITNSSYLTGRSHPLMRRSLLTSFHKAWIDNLNGDKFRTGKLIPRDLPGAGTADQSAFTTDADPRGIQPGTAIVTWLKRPEPHGRPEAADVLYRDLWGTARWKRQALLSSLPGAEPSAKASAPTYVVVAPTSENRWRLSPRALEAGYEDWPSLDEMFPVTFQAVFSGRGLTGSWIDVDRDVLRHRIAGYFGAIDFDHVRHRYPELTVERPRYPARDVWEDLRANFPFSDEKIVRFLTFPFDQRWVYYEPDRKVLDERSPRFWANRESNEFLITVPEPRKASETRPL